MAFSLGSALAGTVLGSLFGGGGSSSSSQPVSLNPELERRLLELQIQGAKSQIGLFDQLDPLRNSFINTAIALTQSGNPQQDINQRLTDIPGLISGLEQELGGLDPTTTTTEPFQFPSGGAPRFDRGTGGGFQILPEGGIPNNDNLTQPRTQGVTTTIDNPRIAEIEDLLSQLTTEQSDLTNISRFSNEDFGLQKQGIDAQFENAAEFLKASLPVGGALIQQLAELEQQRTLALQNAFGNRFDEERNIALALATGSPDFLSAGLNTISQQQAALAQQNSLANSRAIADQQAQSQQKSSLGQAIGKIGKTSLATGNPLINLGTGLGTGVSGGGARIGGSVGII